MQHHAADQLNVKRPHPERAQRGFASHREGFRKNLVERRATSDTLLEFGGLRSERRVVECLNTLFETVDAFDDFGELPKLSLIATAEKSRQEICHKGLLDKPVRPPGPHTKTGILRTGRNFASTHCQRCPVRQRQTSWKPPQRQVMGIQPPDSKGWLMTDYRAGMRRGGWVIALRLRG
jgi:hypothetical protein